jgi:hypothetical protein
MTKTRSASRPPADPDLVDRIFDFLRDDPRLSGMDAKALAAMKAKVRSEFAGEDCYIANRPATARQELVAEVLGLFNGKNSTEVARSLGIGRTTVWRILKQCGGRPRGPLFRVDPARRSTFPGNETAPQLPSDDA